VTQPFGSQFEEPQLGGDRFTAEEARHRRLIIVPIEYVPQIRTQRGEMVDGIRINVVDLDNQGAQYNGALWFGGRLISAFRPKIGKMFLGYLSKEKTQGGFEAWTFNSLTQDEYTKNLATQWLTANPKFLETCQGDVNMAAANPQQSVRQPMQPQQTQPWPQQTQPWPQQTQSWPQQSTWQQPATPPAPPAPPAPPTPPVPVAPPAPSPQQSTWQQPAPATPPVPVAPPAPAAPVAPPVSPPPPPVGGSVVERLRAQAAQQNSADASNGPIDQEQYPF
jgi:hypothetical protein